MPVIQSVINETSVNLSHAIVDEFSTTKLFIEQNKTGKHNIRKIIALLHASNSKIIIYFKN